MCHSYVGLLRNYSRWLSRDIGAKGVGGPIGGCAYADSSTGIEVDDDDGARVVL